MRRLQARGDMSMANRDRSSRWAVAGAILVLIGAGDYVALAMTGGRVLFDAAQVYAKFGFPSGFSEACILFSCVATGPACISLGTLGLRDIRLHPGLRGELLAQLTVIVGWIVTLGMILWTAFIGTMVYLASD